MITVVLVGSVVVVVGAVVDVVVVLGTVVGGTVLVGAAVVVVVGGSEVDVVVEGEVVVGASVGAAWPAVVGGDVLAGAELLGGAATPAVGFVVGGLVGAEVTAGRLSRSFIVVGASVVVVTPVSRWPHAAASPARPTNDKNSRRSSAGRSSAIWSSSHILNHDTAQHSHHLISH